MDNQTPNIDLGKQQSYTDPVTGEIYPGQAAPPSQQFQPAPGSVPYAPQPQYPPQPQQMPMSNMYPQQPQAPMNGMYPQPQQQMPMNNYPQQGQMLRPLAPGMKYCAYCGNQMDERAQLCTNCGIMVQGAAQAQQPQQIVINNTVQQSNENYGGGVGIVGVPKNKWVAFFLCFFLGYLGAHRFYEGKVGTAFIWMFTGGFFGIGYIYDLIKILTRPNPYYVYT